MNSNCKYLLYVAGSGNTVAVLFSSEIDHQQMASDLKIATVTGAGFVTIDAEGIWISGGSTSLNLTSKVDDGLVIGRQLGYNWDKQVN